MARTKVGAPAGAEQPAKKPEIIFPKCECPGEKPGAEVLAKSGGRCPRCLRGVFVALPELSDADENAASIMAAGRAPVAPSSVPMPAAFPSVTVSGQGLTASVPPQAAPIFQPIPPAMQVAHDRAVQRFGDGTPERAERIARATHDMVEGDHAGRAVAEIDTRAHEGDEVTIELQPERYGPPQTFSSYGVPMVRWTTRVRPGEHPAVAQERASRMAHRLQDRERVEAKARFLEHLPTAFTKA